MPWNEHGVLIRTSAASVQDGGRVIVAEAALFRLVALLAAYSPADVQQHFIALPERRTAPFRYDGAGILTLLGRIDRPGVAPPPPRRIAQR